MKRPTNESNTNVRSNALMKSERTSKCSSTTTHSASPEVVRHVYVLCIVWHGLVWDASGYPTSHIFVTLNTIQERTQLHTMEKQVDQEARVSPTVGYGVLINSDVVLLVCLRHLIRG